MKLKVVAFINIIAKSVSVLEFIVFAIVVVGSVVIKSEQIKLTNAIDSPAEFCSFFSFIQFGGLT